MVDKSFLILLAKEAAIVVLNHAVEEQKKTLLEKTEKLNEDYYNRVKEIVGKPSASPLPPPAHEHSGGEGCKTCGQVDFKRRVDNQAEPHDVAGGKDPHLSYTVRETAKHLALLQNHYVDYRCQNCIPTGDMVYANPSVKAIEDVEVGDRVLTHEGSYGVVKEKYVRDYTGDIYSVSLGYSSTPLRATPEHPILGLKNVRNVQKDLWRKDHRIDKMSLSWIPIDQLSLTDFVAFPRLKGVSDVLTIDILDVLKDDSSIILDGSNVIPVNYSPTRIPLQRFIKADEDFLELSGYYLSEGTSSVSKAYRGGQLTFSLGKHETFLIYRIKDLLKKVLNIDDAKVRVREGRTGIYITVGSSIATKLFGSLYGHRASEKKLPLWIFTLPESKQYRLIEAMLRGDGCIGKYSMTYCTISRTLAFQIRIILFRLGLLHGYHVKESRANAIIEGRHVNERDSYHLHISGDSARKLSAKTGLWFKGGKTTAGNHGYVTDDYVFFPVVGIEKRYYSGQVHNLHVEGGNSYVLTQGAVHNCIGKHLMVIEGLAEEGIPMTKDPLEKQKFQEVRSWVKQAQGRSDWDNLVEESRQARLLLTGMEHVADDDHNGA